jgi:predicted transcriptional regulator
MIPWRDVFPEFQGNEAGTTLSGYRHREGMTQMQLAEATGIPQRHIREMESGKRITAMTNYLDDRVSSKQMPGIHDR